MFVYRIMQHVMPDSECMVKSISSMDSCKRRWPELNEYYKNTTSRYCKGGFPKPDVIEGTN